MRKNIVYIFNRCYVSQMLTVTNSILQNEKKELADSIEFYLTYFGSKREKEYILKKAKKNFPNNKYDI